MILTYMKVIKPTNNNELYIQVDDDLFDELDKFKWHIHYANKTYESYLGLNYATRSEGNKTIFMHREIAGMQISDRKNCNSYRWRYFK